MSSRVVRIEYFIAVIESGDLSHNLAESADLITVEEVFSKNYNPFKSTVCFFDKFQ
jgi:hypothetical protein